ncbi:TPA: tail fiber assembly protein [Enterobacter asburiae]
MKKYLFSELTFYPYSEKDTYVQAGKWPEHGVDVDEETRNMFFIYPVGKTIGENDEGMPVWIDLPQPPNSDLRKAALTELSNTYQDDIEKLNRAWLAAAVNDGVNETAKKDLVLAQINTRKTQYSNDRAAIIAQYP